MERLTEENPTWIDDEFWTSTCEPSMEEIEEVYQKLQDYEDTGLTPEEIMEHEEIFKAYRNVCGGLSPALVEEVERQEKEIATLKRALEFAISNH